MFNRAQLEAWLRNPPAQKPMYTDPTEGEAYRGMPDLDLTEDQIDQLVDYLVDPRRPRRARPAATADDSRQELMAIAEIPQGGPLALPAAPRPATTPTTRSASSPGPPVGTAGRRG